MSKKENKVALCSDQLEEIENLFKFAPPKNMKRSLMEVYTVYLQNLDNMDFKEVATDIYFLNKLLEKIEEIISRFPTNPQQKGE